MSYFVKDPQSTLDYVVDWKQYLKKDTIASASVVVQTGLTLNLSTNDDTTTTIWVSGGVSGTTYNVTSTIVTTGGRTDSRSFDIAVSDM